MVGSSCELASALPSSAGLVATEDEDGEQKCFCYDPEAPPSEISINLKKGGTWSKQGNRRMCAWDRCVWDPADDCSCMGGLNQCYMEGSSTTVNSFDVAALSPLPGFDPNILELESYKLTAAGDDLEIGYGGDYASDVECFDGALRGGFSVDLDGTGFQIRRRLRRYR